MNSISIFLEVDSESNPIYKEIFLDKVKNGERVYASQEYAQLVESWNIEYDIPKEVIEHLDEQVSNKADRTTLLKISYQPKMEEWFERAVDSYKNCDEIVLFGDYESIVNVACKKELPCLIYIQRSVTMNEKATERYYVKTIQEMRNHIGFVEEQLNENGRIIEQLRDNIKSDGQYIHNLEEHAANLDNNLKKYKAFYDENHEKIESINQQSDYYEQRIREYLDMYQSVMKELDEKKTEVLELRTKVERKK